MSEDDGTRLKSDKRGRGVSGELPPGLRVTLEVIDGPEIGKKFEIKKQVTSIGRKGTDIELSDPTVSGRHCTLEVGGEDIFIYDDNSTNGTFVNGERVSSCPLQNMDEIQLGETKLFLSVVIDRYALYQEGVKEEIQSFIPSDSVQSSESTVIDSAPVENPELEPDIIAVLEVEEGPNKGERYHLKRRSTVLGRKGADIILNDETVSARHCQIEIHGKDKITIKDLASTNGTRVNGRLVSAVKLHNEDRIKIGKTELVFYLRTK